MAPDLEVIVVWTLAAMVAAAIVVPYAVVFRRRRRHDRDRLAEARELGINRPTAQYPFVEPEHCIGCGACVRACPEGDVLGIVGGVAVVINGLRCVGHGRCAIACPVEAIEIGLGDLKSRRDVPLMTPEQETTIAGVFVAGELSGLALIRNAIDQGARVLRAIAGRELAAARRERAPGVVDVLIVGAGPAGVAAALAARELGLAARIVDQAQSLGGTILHFPRRKMVLTQPVPLPGGSALSREEYSKEELLELLGARIADRRLDVRFGEQLTGIAGSERDFTVSTSGGEHRARYVVLALGRRGTPRKLGVPGEEREKVMYQLREAESYRGQQILVVGGGDSAVEAAVGLARQAGNQVTISYRKNAFYRIKQKNQSAVESAIARGKVRALFDSQVTEIEEDHVTLSTSDGILKLDNQYVFVFIGGEAPYRFLEGLGVRFGGDTRKAPPPLRVGTAALVAALALFAAPLAAQESPHGAIEITCDQCHDTESWKLLDDRVEFRHEVTGYSLAGAHARAACIDCHQSRVFSQVPTACQDCHRDAHSGELGRDCARCHDPRRWDNRSEFRAAHARTLFPLLGGHARTDCESCHSGSPPRQYTLVATDCPACHAADFRAASTPAHGLSPTDCRICHVGGAESWSRSNFRHPDRFPLSGAHAGLDCADCHRGPASQTSADCYECHRADYDSTRDPNHRAAGFPTACAACHTTVSWTSAVFNHFTTGFPLDGAHRNAACSSCHTSGYAGTPRDCASCHLADYDATNDPDHAAAGFPTTCESCHDTTSWEGAAFDHAATGFALTGTHRAIDCTECHRSGYAGTPRDCVACHRADYDQTTDPNHASAGFPTTCESCHSTTTWAGAAIDHSQTRFPLTGAHVGLDCGLCHTSGFAGTPRDCASCHLADYNATNDPDHAAANFPTTCESCHSTNSWSGATFDHDSSFFPIYSGKHRGTWSSCSTCHVVAGNYQVFDCTVCHGKSQTDSQHSGVSGYSYTSTACYSCHPDGQGDD